MIAYPFNDFDGLELAPQYVAARAAHGLTRVRLPYGETAWLVTRYADARLVLSERRFSRAVALDRDAPTALSRVPGGIVTMDPPELTRVRSLAAKAFTARRVERLRPHVRSLAGQLIDAMITAGPPADLVRDFALPIPVSVICELLGVPAEDHEKFRVWNDSLLSTSATAPAMRELTAYIGGLIELRRAEPADDLMTALIEARDVNDRLSAQELMLLCIAILVAGYEATASQIPNFTYTLLDRPEDWARLRAQPDLVDDAVEELLRFVPLASSAMFAHYALEDVQVGDALVHAGEPVLVSIGSANRDELRFAGADTLDLGRADHAHLAFGYGLHRCIGAPLGRIELQEALRALVTRLPGLRLAGDPAWKTETFFRGPRTMPVSW
ncbi:cytochrome P450 [Nonomuraea sp. NPDC049400]|uniref:cytochrome P450 n=1 Tax=Nonomuraea sp. NPDC049400 TaxID=3364352 RepID=UPI0037AF6263